MVTAAEFLASILFPFRTQYIPLFGSEFVERYIRENRLLLEEMLEPLIDEVNRSHRPSMVSTLMTRLLDGETVIVGDAELDALSNELKDDDGPDAARVFRELTTAPNPKRVGVRDAYVASLRPESTNAGTSPGHEGDHESHEDDPDEVTPEKDAIVMAAFDRLVAQRGSSSTTAESLPAAARFAQGRRERFGAGR